MANRLGTISLWLAIIAGLAWIWISTAAGIDTEHMALGTALLVVSGIGARFIFKDSL